MHNPDNPQCYPGPTSPLFGGDFFDQHLPHCHCFPSLSSILRLLSRNCEFLICYMSTTNLIGFVLTILHPSYTCTPDLQPFSSEGTQRTKEQIQILLQIIIAIVIVKTPYTQKDKFKEPFQIKFSKTVHGLKWTLSPR